MERATRRRQTREKIRAAAWQLFTTRGFEDTTTQAIAQRAGVAAGTVFLHASDKIDLLFLVMHERLANVVEDRFATVPKGPLVDRLMHVFGGLFAMYGEHPGVSFAFVKNVPGASGPNARELGMLTAAFIQRLALLVADAQHAGEVSKEIEPLVAGQNFFALYYMALIGWLSGMATLESALDPLLKESLRLQFRGLRA